MKTDRKKQVRVRLLAVCYLLVALVWLLASGFLLARDGWLRSTGRLERRELTVPDDFVLVSGLRYPDDWGRDRWLASTDSDPQLVMEFPSGQRVGRLVFNAKPVNRGIGDMVLYYTTRPGEDFSDRNKLWARQAAGGSWYFDLNGRTVTQLRLDPDSIGGVLWQVEALVLNEEKPAIAYFIPDALQAAILLLAPLLIWAVLWEARAFFKPIITSWRLENRWRKQTAKPQP